VAKVLLPFILSNLHNLETKRDTTKEHEMNLISIDSVKCLFVVSLSVFKLGRFETYEREQYFCH